MLREAAADALSRLDTVAAAREGLDGAAPLDVWSTAREAGWTGLLIGEEHGGAGLGAFDGHRANHFCIIGGWPNSADDGVAETLLPHIFETSQQQGCANSVFSCLRFDAGGAEEVGTGGVMAGKSYDFAFLDRDEAGDRLAVERDLDFAGPSLAESFPHPSGDLMLFRGQSAAHDDSSLAQPLKRGP